MRPPENLRADPLTGVGGSASKFLGGTPLPGNEAVKRLTWVGRAAMKRHSQRLPRYGERTFEVAVRRREYLVLWTRARGWRVLASRDIVAWYPKPPWCFFLGGDPVPIPRRFSDPASLVPPDLPTVTKVLAKFPLLVAFLTARSYVEGGVRLPGKIWFEGSTAGFALTLIDQDQAMRLTVRAGAIDDVLAAAELALGADNAPWEVDEYQANRLANKKSKKK